MKVLFLSSYPPRRCGIATFTFNLIQHLKNYYPRFSPAIIAIDDSKNKEIHQYGKEVVFVMDQSLPSSYERAAVFVNDSSYPLLHVQHEYGIYGGAKCFLILKLVQNLKKPFIVTFHSVSPEPEEWEKEILLNLHSQSLFTIVQSKTAKEIFLNIYGGKMEKLIYIPHGVPKPPSIDREKIREKLGWKNRFVILTFGLLNPRKGLEDLIQATSLISKEFPQVYTVILGRPHPRWEYKNGELYLNFLRKLAKDKGVEKNIFIPGEYLPEEELLSALLASDLVVTPYNSHAEKQVVSGVLTYALGCGKAVVSTPYLHAKELLSSGAGLLAEFENPISLAEKIKLVIKDRELHKKMESKALNIGQQFYWEEVAKKYWELYQWVYQQ
ncbi:glycosyltransferase [Candidatus Calescamantes bacterium]|nr:glycosyltransferase [Candidatus Calescamantes bacterium]